MVIQRKLLRYIAEGILENGGNINVDIIDIENITVDDTGIKTNIGRRNTYWISNN